MGKYNPLVSIITPILNNVGYLRLCIESVLRQTYPNVEHIFVDGCSTDGTVEMLAKYHKQYPNRVRYTSEADDCRDTAANKGIKMARGQIIGVLGSDDYYELDAVDTAVHFFRAKKKAFFVFGGCNYIDERCRVIKRIPERDFTLESFINDHMYVNMTSAFYKREVFDKVGLLYTNLEATMVCDTDFVIRVGKTFKIYRIEKVLSNFRMHHWKFSGESWRKQKTAIRNNYRVCRRNGASIFSWASKTYCESLLIDWLRPVFGLAYPFVEKIVDKHRFKRK